MSSAPVLPEVEAAARPTGSPLRIAFVHPVLGIGGAERLVVDAALGLRAAGHDVTIYTTHYDPSRCFEEARDGRLDIRVHGDFLPRHVAGRLLALCAITRMLFLAAKVASSTERFDVVFCDLVSHAIPVLRRSGAPVVFYCHFPDRLLAPRGGVLRRLYRAPIDSWEQWSTGLADLVLVNSRFTASAFAQAFPALAASPPSILSPAVDVAAYSAIAPLRAPGVDGDVLLVSVNRFESRKNLELLVEAFALLCHGDERAQRLRLVLAGGYDERLADNRETLAGLEELAQRLQVAGRVAFEKSISAERRLELLAACRCVAYTPSGEHFGYGPLEAMAAARPVVAVRSGGPMETVDHGRTGFLCDATPADFAAALGALVDDAGLAARMGNAGRERAAALFSLPVFTARLDETVRTLARSRRGER